MSHAQRKRKVLGGKKCAWMEARAVEYHSKINGGGNTPGKRQTTRPAGERMLTNLTRQTQTVWADSLHVSENRPNPWVLTIHRWGVLCHGTSARKPCVKRYLTLSSNTSSATVMLMERDSFVDSVDSLITKVTQTSARVEFLETSGWGGPSGEHFSHPPERKSAPCQ